MALPWCACAQCGDVADPGTLDEGGLCADCAAPEEEWVPVYGPRETVTGAFERLKREVQERRLAELRATANSDLVRSLARVMNDALVAGPRRAAS